MSSKKFFKYNLFFPGIVFSVAAISGCSTLSVEQCASGNWLERGYKDGGQGLSSLKISDYADACAEYGFKVNSTEYLRGHRDGVVLYCTYDNGFKRGETGSDYNQVCAGAIGGAFSAGYEAGRERYAIYQERQALINVYEEKREKLLGIRSRFDETDLMAGDIKRLRKKEARVEAQLEDIRIDIRALERLYGLSRHDF